MRVLQIINSLGTGGAEKLLLDTIPLYRAQGIEMDILLLWDNDTMFTRELQKMNCCKIHIIKKSNRIQDIYNPFAIFKIAKLLKQYDLAHVHLFPAQYYVVFANLWNGNKTKLVFTEHNTTNTRLQRKIFKGIEEFIYKRYSKIVCITEEIKQIYSNYLPKFQSKFQVIQNGVAIDKIQNTIPYSKVYAPFYLNTTDKIILQVAAFRSQKDQPTLIKAMPYLDNHFKLFLVGDGDTLENCQLLCKDLGLENRIFFLGQRNDIPQLLKTADYVVLSSYYEGLSLASIEGLASGKPFIASDVAGLHDIVKGYGLLFEKGNSEQLAQIIISLDSNETLYQEVATSGMARANEFDNNKMILKHIELYKAIYEN